MKVKELIELLSKKNPEADVKLCYNDGYDCVIAKPEILDPNQCTWINSKEEVIINAYPIIE